MSNDIKIIDNFLEEDEFNIINDIITARTFPWHHSSTVAHESDPHEVFQLFLYHMIYDKDIIQSSYYKPIVDIFFPRLKSIYDFKSLIRIKVNFYPATQNLVEHLPHTDFPWNHHGALFSLNTCDGFTRFGKNEDQIVGSKENRILFFNPSILHNSTNTTNSQARININFNFL